MEGIKNDHPEISPSMIFALAAMEENCVFLSGSPQNTLCPALTKVPGSKGILRKIRVHFMAIIVRFIKIVI